MIFCIRLAIVLSSSREACPPSLFVPVTLAHVGTDPACLLLYPPWRCQCSRELSLGDIRLCLSSPSVFEVWRAKRFATLYGRLRCIGSNGFAILVHPGSRDRAVSILPRGDEASLPLGGGDGTS